MNYSINKILVPVDLSETSLNALDAAVRIAKKHRAMVRVLNIKELSFYPEENGKLCDDSKRSGTDVLIALTNSIRHAEDLDCELIQEEGHITGSIIKFSRAEGCDLVVMGTHGASGYREGFIGSNTYDVIRFSRCPVLTIPPKRKFNLFEKVLFPVRPVSGAMKRYNIACHFLSDNGVLDVLGLSFLKLERNTATLDKLVEGLKDKTGSTGIKIQTGWSRGNSVSDDILEHSQHAKPDLIILASSLDAISKPDFIGPHAQRIIHRSNIPLLTINEYRMHEFV